MKRTRRWNLCFATTCLVLLLGVGMVTSQAASADDYPQSDFEKQLQEVRERYPLVAGAISAILDHRVAAPCNLNRACFEAWVRFCPVGREFADCRDAALAACCEPPVLAPTDPPDTPDTPPCPGGGESPAGTRVTSDAEALSNVVTRLLPACQLGAEFWRCECAIDGIQTSCDLVNSCLQAGFCVQVAIE